MPPLTRKRILNAKKLQHSQVARAVSKFDAIQNAPNYPHGFFTPANFGGAMREHILQGRNYAEWKTRAADTIRGFNVFLVKLGKKPFKEVELRTLYKNLESKLKKNTTTKS